MQNRNMFAVAATDLRGNWTKSSGSYAQMDYSNTGNYAGMNAISFNVEFWIEPKSRYRSQHKGASGKVGNQSFYQLEYKRRYSMNSNWEVSFSNRHNRKQIPTGASSRGYLNAVSYIYKTNRPPACIITCPENKSSL